MAVYTLEKLRYQQWVKNGKVGAVMQGLGDWARHPDNASFPIGVVLLAYALMFVFGWW